MNYRKDKYGNDISILGYGCMRFTTSAGRIDLDKAEKEVMEAHRQGVNYFDTAYVYPGSEECLGKILAKNIWEYDKLKNKIAIENNFNIEYIWENDMNNMTDDEVFNYIKSRCLFPAS